MANAVTSSAALTELQSDLTQLSATLHEVYDLMNTDMSQVGQAWQDGKYQEFVDGFKHQIRKCEDISKQYKLWCTKVLTPQIQHVEEIERTDVGGGGVQSVSTSTTADGINSSDQGDGSVPHYNRWQRNMHKFRMSGLSDADFACQKSYGGFGGTMHAVPADVVKKHEGSGFVLNVKDPADEFKVGAKATVGGKISAGPASVVAEAGPEVSYTMKGVETEMEIGCMSEKKMEELSRKEGVSFNM